MSGDGSRLAESLDGLSDIAAEAGLDPAAARDEGLRVAAALAESVPRDSDAIDMKRITALTGADWGLCHTIERNLRGVADFARERRPGSGPFDPIFQADTLLEAIAAGPKSLAWRLRSRVGERVRWYETPEEIRH